MSNRNEPEIEKIKIDESNVVKAMKLANETRILAQKNAHTSDLNGRIAECDARIKSAKEVLSAEERTRESLVAQAGANVASAQVKQAERDKVLKEMGVDEIPGVLGIDITMELEQDEIQEFGEDSHGLVIIMRNKRAKKPPKKPAAGDNGQVPAPDPEAQADGDRSLDAPVAGDRP